RVTMRSTALSSGKGAPIRAMEESMSARSNLSGGEMDPVPGSAPSGAANSAARRWTRRRFLGGTAMLFASASAADAFLAACSGSGTGASQTAGQPKSGGHVIDSGPSDVKNFNYYISADGYTWIAASMMFDSLISFD